MKRCDNCYEETDKCICPSPRKEDRLKVAYLHLSNAVEQTAHALAVLNTRMVDFQNILKEEEK